MIGQIKVKWSGLAYLVPAATLLTAIISTWVFAIYRISLGMIAPVAASILVVIWVWQYLKDIYYFIVCVFFRKRFIVFCDGEYIVYLDRRYCMIDINDVKEVIIHNEGSTRREFVEVKRRSSNNVVKIATGHLEGRASALTSLLRRT